MNRVASSASTAFYSNNIFSIKQLRANARLLCRGLPIASPSAREVRAAVTQRVIEALIGRLITDEGFRAAFLSDPHKTLRDLVERGLQLMPGEKSDCDARVSPMIQGSPLIQPTGGSRPGPLEHGGVDPRGIGVIRAAYDSLVAGR
jgi:hypothetical protein